MLHSMMHMSGELPLITLYLGGRISKMRGSVLYTSKKRGREGELGGVGVLSFLLRLF